MTLEERVEWLEKRVRDMETLVKAMDQAIETILHRRIEEADKKLQRLIRQNEEAMK